MISKAKQELSYNDKITDFYREKEISLLLCSKLISNEMPSIDFIKYFCTFFKAKGLYQSTSVVNMEFEKSLGTCLAKTNIFNIKIKVPVILLRSVKEVVLDVNDFAFNKVYCMHSILTSIVEMEFRLNSLPQYLEKARNLEKQLLEFTACKDEERIPKEFIDQDTEINQQDIIGENTDHTSDIN